MRLNLLKFVYRGLLTGMPILTYNPITKNTLNMPLTVKPYSTYLNFKLNYYQSQYLNNYISEYTNSLELVPINIFPNDPYTAGITKKKIISNPCKVIVRL